MNKLFYNLKKILLNHNVILLLSFFIILSIYYLFFYKKTEKFNNQYSENSTNLLTIEQNNNLPFTTIIQYLDYKYYLNNNQKKINLFIDNNLIKTNINNDNQDIDLLLFIKLLNNVSNPKINCNYYNQYFSDIFTNLTFTPQNGYMILLGDKYSAYDNDVLWINNHINEENVFFGLKNKNMTLNIHHNQNIILSIKLKKINNY